MAVTRIILNPKGREYTVADVVAPNEIAGHGGIFLEAPEPWASQVARYWRPVSPFERTPWAAFPVETVDEDAKLTEFETVQGVLMQRGDYVAGGGKSQDYTGAAQRYWKDYEFYLGIISGADVPAELASQLTAANPEFVKYGLGEGGLNKFLGGGTVEQTNIYFPGAPLTPKQSGTRGRFFHRHEAVDRAFHVSQIICEYQELLIRAGTKVALPHPTLPVPLQQMNAQIPQ